MATQFGTLQTTDTLQSLRVSTGTVASLGEDRVWDAVNAALIAHNKILSDIVSPFVEFTTQRLRRYGGPASVEMEELDEHGTPQAQKISAGAFVGFPLRKFGAAVQWTRDYFAVCQASEFAAQVTAVFAADVRRLQRDIKRALYYPTSVTFYDRLIDMAVLGVKPLVNADSQPIPLGPNGELFTASTHTHYLAAVAAWSGASVAQKTADVTALINTVIEHYTDGKAYVYINQAEEANFRLLTGFVAYVDARIVGPTTSFQANGVSLDPTNIYNRAIGIFNGAEIWVKPWIVSGYPLCFIEGQPKPLVFRVRGTGADGTEGGPSGIMGSPTGNTSVPGMGDLLLAAENEMFPLRAKTWVREFGIGAWNRINGAVLDTAHTTYTQPTIT